MPFAIDIHNVIHGRSQYPQLHRVYRNRHNAGVRKLSRCPDKFKVKRTKRVKGKPVYARTDSREFQLNTKYNDFPFIGMEWNRNEREMGMRTFLMECCPTLTERFIIYGTIGRGSYGVVFAARERNPRPGQEAKHFALKVERHAPICRGNETSLEANCPYKELGDTSSNPVNRYVLREAILLRLLSESDRFPTLDSVYVHEHFQVMVMSADSIDDDPLRSSLGSVLEYPTKHKFPGYPGTNLMQRRRKATKLNEMEVCKVASQLLESLMYLMDMNIVHDDLSHRNYLVDEELNTQMIDLGLVTLSLKEDGFRKNYWSYIEAQEYQMSPELAIEMSKDYWLEQEGGSDPQVEVFLPHDCRVEMLWKFGVLIYDLLHGYSPWEDADDLEVVPLRSHPLTVATANLDRSDLFEPEPPHKPEDSVPSRGDILMRRRRIINEELPIDEHLSQDCVDVLRSMFEKDPKDRPTLQALCTYPWFQGWWVDEGPFQRPGRTGTSQYPGASAGSRH